MAGDGARAHTPRERRFRRSRTMAPLLGLVRRGSGDAWTGQPIDQATGLKVKSRRFGRGLRALCATERFRLWVAFVLAPEELIYFERWAVTNDMAYNSLLRSYREVRGGEDQEILLDTLRAVAGLGDDGLATQQAVSPKGLRDDDGISS